jgi:hypothetical protein
MLLQLTLHTQQIIKATSTQDLDPRPLANNEHPSILPFEMSAIGFLFHFGRFGFAPLSVCQFQHSLDLLSVVHVMSLTMMFVEIICRLAKLSRRLHRFMIG